jgi:Flp pilus assembly pilin Flp
MFKLNRSAARLWKNVQGQDMIEYALMAAAIAVACYGFLPTTIMPAVSTVFSKIISSYNAS